MYKHSHFMAHSSNVNCFRFGRKSGQVAVSGGDDTNVNLWRIRENETKNIMSLVGHSSPVECVVFDPSEKKVVAGSKSGAIKAYDMEAAKVYRTLKGHMSNCTAIDYHLYGDYVASGALDTNVKIWDLKTKNCVQTFKGHRSEVTCVSFTPDGRWLTSGDADGSLKIWDLTAGKLLKEFNDHNGAIVCLEFNPEEYILLSASTDKTIRFWDVQDFALLGLTPTDNAVTTSISHTVSEPYSGKFALCSSQDAIRVWSYDHAVQCHDTLPWNRDSIHSERLGDTLVTDNLQLFGGSFNNAFVSVWRVDLAQLQPFVPPKPIAPSRPAPPLVGSNASAYSSRVDVKPSTPASGPAPPLHASAHLLPPRASSPAMNTSTATQMGPDTIKRFSIDDAGQLSDNKMPPPAAIPDNADQSRGDDAVPPPPPATNVDYVKELRCGMEGCIRTMRSRQKSLDQFMTYWGKGDVHGGFRYLGQLPTGGHREAMTHDILGAIDITTIGLDLEGCVLVLPLASELVATPSSSYIATGVAVAKMLVGSFGPLVRDNRESRKNSREINFASEDRAARCDACFHAFVDLQRHVQRVLDTAGSIGIQPTVLRDVQEFRGLLSEYCWVAP
ncbi:hypothetical protein, variant [Aphanomyces invadans]|uniref:Katanin p80 WD40 repeat-containing subunit B1 homolog n=1 Tax=Aphanomyces invadans TaxID=157072 RepID=A0A024UXB9_9STRA|nr:hypothetical protein H310_00654 [Aphanomyces invadans]XP_008861734.1 hypothetical protein, variant [Aphanomyces invadans]ETW10322.1 hypothetical protein H310_00654 [Aphanomyces invadans]ETW10323.1 hypothetical protein, variant [Aphanomyces invadans]|eukprot:XP_008861733.1 hypothetical protein H310_00654 [Aphanomyces invadans]